MCPLGPLWSRGQRRRRAAPWGAATLHRDRSRPNSSFPKAAMSSPPRLPKAIIRKIYDNRAERFGFVDSVAGRRFDGIPSIMSLSSASGMAQHGSRPVRKRVQGRASLSAGEVLMALGTGFSVFGTSSATSNAEVCEHRSSRLSRNLRLTLVRSSSSWGDLRGQTPCPIP
jgi:hypothetical protein